MRIGHTSVHKGKRVLIHYKDGRIEVDRFLEKRSTFIVCERLGNIPIEDIRRISIYKEAGNERDDTG